MYNYRVGHFETEMQITQFTELYLALTMSECVQAGVEVCYQPQSLTYSIAINIECDGIKVSVCYDYLDESADANDITDVMQSLIEELRDKYGREVSRNLLRRGGINMTYNDLLNIIFETKKANIKCNMFGDSCAEIQHIDDESEYGNCFECRFRSLGEQQVDIARLYANLSTSEIGKCFHKAVLNSLYGKTDVYADTDSTKFKEMFESASAHANFFPMNPPIEDEWIEVPSGILDGDITHLTAILDDATVHGLDFKYEKGKYYFKECATVHN